MAAVATARPAVRARAVARTPARPAAALVRRAPPAAHAEAAALAFALAAAAAAAAPAALAGEQPVFAGEYDDPSHPGCERRIAARGACARGASQCALDVFGADPVPIAPGAKCLPGDKVTPWKLEATYDPARPTVLAIDFDPIDEVKQGPVKGEWTGEGLQLPNGLWTKK